MSPALAATTLAAVRPSRSFRAVLTELGEQRRGYVRQLAIGSGVDEPTTSRVLARMARLGLVERTPETGTRLDLGRLPRVYYRITPVGDELAQTITSGVAR